MRLTLLIFGDATGTRSSRKVGRLALDGTKIKAFSEIASRHGWVSNRAMSDDRRQTEEVRLQNEIRERLAQAEAEDQAENAVPPPRTPFVKPGADQRGQDSLKGKP